MRISLMMENVSPAHTRFTVFVNGAKAGTLTVRNEEYLPFNEIIQLGMSSQALTDAFVQGGTIGLMDEAERQATSIADEAGTIIDDKLN